MKYLVILLSFISIVVGCNNQSSNDKAESIHYDSLSIKDDRAYLNNELYSGEAFIEYPNGIIKVKSHFTNGYENGEYKSWDSLGNIFEQYEMKDNKIHGSYEVFYPNGQLYFKTTYTNGKLDGEAHEWYENGQLKLNYQFVAGMEEGLYRFWNKNGILILEGSMRDGKRNGKWNESNIDGSNALTNTYSMGEIIRSVPHSVTSKSKISFNQNEPFTITSFQRSSDYPSSDTDTTQCVHWQLNQEQISDVISGFTAINGSEWHYLFGVYPCVYSGTLKQNEIEFKFAINSGSWLHLISDTTVFYGDIDGEFNELFLDSVWDEEDYE